MDKISEFDKELAGTIDPQQLQKCRGCICYNSNPYLCWVDRDLDYNGLLDEYEIEQAGGPCQCTCHDDYWEAIHDENEECF